MRLKKYLYVLRPLLAIRWLEAGLGVVPTEFQALIDRTLDDPAVRSAIEDLLAAKAAGAELDRGPRIVPISQFIEMELARHEGARFDGKGERCPWEVVNGVFREMLETVWSG